MSAKSANKETLTDYAYKYIKDKIQNCDYMPGQLIYENQFNEDLNIGRTPIREALLKLSNEGLITIFPRKGMQINPIEKKKVKELYQVRKLLEPAVIQEYKAMYPKDILLNYEQELAEYELNRENSLEADKAFYNMDIRFHSFFIEYTQNQMLIRMYNSVMECQYRLAIYGAKIKSTNRQHNYQQHLDIIRAVCAEDDEAIHQALLKHINYSLITLLRTLEL